MKKKNVDMLSGSVTKGLLAMTIPIMIMNVVQCLFSIADSAILKKFGYESAVGAVGACGTLIVLFTGLLIGLSVGANVVVARYIGAGNKKKAEDAVVTSILLALTGGALLMLVGAVFAQKLLEMINCPETLLEQATTYFRIYFYGVPIIMLYNFTASILRASGDTKRPMYFLIIGGIVKLSATVVVVKCFGKAEAGVAIATIISNSVSFALSFFTLLKRKDIISFNIRKMRFHLSELKAILFNGVPAGFQSSMYALANVVIATAVNSFGPDATTGIAIANQYDGILYQISYAPSLAVIPYVAQNIGAGNLKRAKEAMIKAMLITVSFGASLGMLSAIFSRQLSSLLSSSPAVLDFSQQKMIIVSSTYFICGINEVIGGTLKGMGKPISPAITSLLFLCVLRFIWVYVLFPIVPNMTFLYSVWPVGWLLSALVLFAVYFVNIARIEKRNTF